MLLLRAARQKQGVAIGYLKGDMKEWNQYTRIEVKRELARLGHYSGPIDDKWDDKGRQAFRAYMAQPS
jgi:Putative peptidoglycan binding domain